ncbi:TetR family transcriptional regulator [Salinibius halmophilus]|uniref:TetR family transcriptional regulator n=1 Tax=Salinibius halmophilus TaxID=1853216 RepID=UPI000E667FD9|nr:TetR family transcriptional regulator [Salinibius halmophilus]
MSWHRARSAEQIEDRVNSIITAAAELFESHRFEDISLVMIGKRINFTRSNVYRYFDSKEEIFLHLLLKDIGVFRQALTQLPPPPDLATFCQQWLTAALNQPRLMKLFSLLYQMLEHHATPEALFAFKRGLASEHQQLTRLLSAWFPNAKQVEGFLFAQLPMISGMYPLLVMSPLQQQALQQAGLPAAQTDYRSLLSQSLMALAHQFLAPQVESGSE